MPKLILKPFLEVLITKDQELAILDFMASDEQIMTVNKTTFHRSAFAYIQPGGLTEADKPKLIPENKRITQPTANQETIDKIRKRLVRKGIIKSS